MTPIKNEAGEIVELLGVNVDMLKWIDQRLNIS